MSHRIEELCETLRSVIYCHVIAYIDQCLSITPWISKLVFSSCPLAVFNSLGPADSLDEYNNGDRADDCAKEYSQSDKGEDSQAIFIDLWCYTGHGFLRWN